MTSAELKGLAARRAWASYTPEQRAARSARAAAARKGIASSHVFTPEYRAKMSATKKAEYAADPSRFKGLSRSGWRPGTRWQEKPRTAEEIAARAAKVAEGLRKKHAADPDYRKRVGEANRRQWQGLPDAVKKALADKRAAAARIQQARPEYAAKQSAIMKAVHARGDSFDLRKLTPEQREKGLRMARDAYYASPLSGLVETNVHAAEWHVRDPLGRVWHFRNLRHFARQHPELFEYDVETQLNRISGGMGSISPRRRKPNCSWKGWTWVHGSPVNVGGGLAVAVDPLDELQRTIKDEGTP